MSKLFRAAVALAALFLMSDLASAAPPKAQKKKQAGAVAGKVKAVDAQANTITLEGRKNKKTNTTGPDRVLSVAKDAKVTINGEAKTLADVQVGEQVSLTLGGDKKTATTVTVAKKKKKKAK